MLVGFLPDMGIGTHENSGRILPRKHVKSTCFYRQKRRIPGVDGIPIEAFKIIRESDALFGEFMKFLHAYWREENVDPEAFHTTLMTVLPKKGSIKHVDDFILTLDYKRIILNKTKYCFSWGMVSRFHL